MLHPESSLTRHLIQHNRPKDDFTLIGSALKTEHQVVYPNKAPIKGQFIRMKRASASRTPHSRATSPIIEASEEAELMAELANAPTADIEVLQRQSWYQVWAKRISGATRLFQSGILLPDPLKSHPYTAPTIVAVVVLLLLLPIRLYCVLIFAGICVGYVIAVPAVIMRRKSKEESTLFDLLMAPLKLGKKTDQVPPTKLTLSPAIDAELDGLLEEMLKDIINVWYVPLCKSGESDFQSCVRSTINAAIMNLVKFGSTRNKDTITLMLYGITNALIVHMEEYRVFEDGKTTMDKFIAAEMGRRSYIKSYCQELEHLRQVSGLLLKKLLPKQESRSILLNSLLREVISGNAFIGLIDRISDPDFINEQIVKFLQDPSEAMPEVEPGWNMIILKVFRGKNLPPHPGSGGIYLVIHMAGRRVKTKRIKEPNQLWNEVFRFKVSNSVRDHLKVYIQLCEFNYLGQDHSLGYAKIIPQFDRDDTDDPMQAPTWLKFTVKSGAGDQPVNRAAMAPKVLVQVTTIVGDERARRKVETSKHDDGPLPELINGRMKDPEKEAIALNDKYGTSKRDPSTFDLSTPDHGAITLEAALQNNELFMEFLEYLNSVKAPPYLQFMMNVDALRQFAAMSLGVESKAAGSLENYFRTGLLAVTQIEQLKMIKHDAADVFSMHFMENSKYRVPLDPGMQQELQEWVNRSDRVDSQGVYVGGPIGPNIFLPAYRWVANILEEVYFPKFKSSETFLRFLDRAKFSVLSFPLDDDRISTCSHDSNIPSNWGYSDQTYIDRQAALSVGDRSRTSSFDNLDDIEGMERAETKRLATQIAINREKLAVIEEQIIKINTAEGREQEIPQGLMPLKDLHKEQEYLQNHIRSLVALLEERNEAFEEKSDELWTDLADAKIKVSLTQDTKFVAGSENVFSSIWSSTMGTMMSAVSEPIFDVEIAQVEKGDGSLPASTSVSMVTRSYSEFRSLHRRLKKEFPKVGKIAFPDQGLLSVDGLDQSLENYLRLLASDEFVRQSNVLRQFVSIDSGRGEDRPSILDAFMGKRVKTAFKSAKSILSSSPPGASSERREHFYETRERHTTIDLSETTETDENQKSKANFLSVTDLPSTNSSPRKSSKGMQLTKPNIRIDQVDKEGMQDSKLSPMPSVEPLTTPRAQYDSSTKSDSVNAASVVEELTDAEIDMLVETFFAFIIETFDLREPNQWLRRKLLGVFKQLLKQAYGDTLNKVATGLINQAFSEEIIIKALKEVKSALYPEGTFIGRRPPPPIRTEEQKFATMVEARTVFLKHTPDFVQNMAGRYNAICGMTRMFHALQYKDFNKALIYACVDIILKLFFSERPSS